jgi:hypothetical protein
LLWALLIGVPIIGIGAMLLLKKPAEEEAEAPKQEVKVNPNDRIKVLESQVRPMEEELRKLQALIRQEDPSAQAMQKTLVSRIDKWMLEWDGFFDPKRLPNGRFPPEFEGYQAIRSKVNQVRHDVLKSSGF